MYIVNFCSDCGSKLPEDAKFCPECGALRYGTPKNLNISAEAYSSMPVAFGMETPKAPISPAYGMGDKPPEKMPEVRLELLVDCCSKVLATAVGDGHDETVLFLNEDTGNYEIHTFNMQPGCPETHHVFLSDKTVYDKVMAKIKETGIAKYENKKERPLCGGDYVCKFRSGDRIVRISLENLPEKKYNLLYSVGSLLGSCIDPEKEIKN